MTSAEYKAMLRNAVRHKVAALTVVEVESRYRAEKLIEELKPNLAERPFETIYFPEPTPSAGIFLKAAYDAVRSWTHGEGVLFLVDAERIQPPDFWREMNSYRESWGALGCHVIFFIAPRNYRLLIQVADHLADWIPLKLHILGEENRILPDSISLERPTFGFGLRPAPNVARDQLEVLQKELDEALTIGLPQVVLVRRYYLPMFQAAWATGSLVRADVVRGHIRDEDITESEKTKWFELNSDLDTALFRLSAAEKWARRLLDFGESNRSDEIVATAWHLLGNVALTQRDLAGAEGFYHKSLDISERLGNETNAANTYYHLGLVARCRWDLSEAEYWFRKSLAISERDNDDLIMATIFIQLGIIAREQGDLSTAEDWCRKTLDISERIGNELYIATTYHHLGWIAQDRKDLSAAEEWHRKSLEISKNLGFESGMARTYQHLGMIAAEGEDLSNSKEYYLKSLEISERLGDEFNTAVTLSFLGAIAYAEGRDDDSITLILDSHRKFKQIGDDAWIEEVKSVILSFYRHANPTMKPKIKERAEQAGIELPSDDDPSLSGVDTEG